MMCHVVYLLEGGLHVLVHHVDLIGALKNYAPQVHRVDPLEAPAVASIDSLP